MVITETFVDGKLSDQGFDRSSDVIFAYPRNIVRVDDCAFHDVVHLQNVQLEDTVREVGISAYYNCKQLYTADLKNATVESRAFERCIALSSVSSSLNSEQFNAFVFDNEIFKDCQLNAAGIEIDGKEIAIHCADKYYKLAWSKDEQKWKVMED